jgi:hypothetical protein
MRTYIVHTPLAAVGPARSHMIRKIMSVGKTVLITTSCSDTFEYTSIMGTDADNVMFYMRKHVAEIRVMRAGTLGIQHKCRRCGWPGNYKKIVNLSVEVTCEENSELERFVLCMNHTLLNRMTA